MSVPSYRGRQRSHPLPGSLASPRTCQRSHLNSRTRPLLPRRGSRAGTPSAPPRRLPALTRPLPSSRRCLQRHLLRARLPVVGPGRCERGAGSRQRERRGGAGAGCGAGGSLGGASALTDPAPQCTTWSSSTAPSRATGASSSSICPTSRSEPPADGLHPASPPSGPCGLLASPGGAPRARAPLFPSSQGKSPFRTLEPLAPLGVCSGSLGRLGLGKCPSPALCLNLFSGLGAAGLVVVCTNKRGT